MKKRIKNYLFLVLSALVLFTLLTAGVITKDEGSRVSADFPYVFGRYMAFSAEQMEIKHPDTTFDFQIGTNFGSGYYNWSISQCPSWLTLSQTSGILNGMESETVTASVDWTLFYAGETKRSDIILWGMLDDFSCQFEISMGITAQNSGSGPTPTPTPLCTPAIFFVEGYVTDEASGAPVPHADIYIENTVRGEIPVYEYVAKADENGYYRQQIHGACGCVSIRIAAQNYNHAARLKGKTCLKPETKIDFELRNNGATPTPPEKIVSHFKPVFSSSNYAPAFSQKNAVDANETTLWGSDASGYSQWLFVDLEQFEDVTGLVIKWDRIHYAKRYRIGISDDGKSWQLVYTKNDGTGGREEIKPITPIRTRYIGVLCETKGPNAIAYGIKEFEVWAVNK